MPARKFTIPNRPSFLPTISELLGAQLPEYEPGYTGRGTLGLEEPPINEMDILLALAPILKGFKIPLGVFGSMRGSLSNKPLKTEAHHTLPIGGTRNLDALDWHLRNLAEGWKTIKDVPKEVHKGITKKQMKDLTKQPISSKEREGILSSLITSPERAELLSDYRRYLLEQVLAQQPKGTKAHLFGSAVSKKPNPKDLDVLLEYPTGRDWWNISQHPEKLPVIPKVDLIPSPPLERVPSNVKKMKEIGKKKYGEDYDFLRILSILGLLPLSSLVGKEE